MSFTNMCI